MHGGYNDSGAYECGFGRHEPSADDGDAPCYAEYRTLSPHVRSASDVPMATMNVTKVVDSGSFKEVP